MTDRFVSSNDLQLVLLVSHLVAAGLGLAYDVWLSLVMEAAR